MASEPDATSGDSGFAATGAEASISRSTDSTRFHDPAAALSIIVLSRSSTSRLVRAGVGGLGAGATPAGGTTVPRTGAGDGASTEQPGKLTFTATRPTEALLFDLN